MSTHLKSLAALVAEMLLWLLPAAAFLTAYVLYFNGPETAIAPHLKLIGSMGVSWLGLRLAFGHGKPGAFSRTAFLIVYSIGLSLLLFYYAMMLTGLTSWGRVPTWRLISVYFLQWRELLMVLDAPVIVVPVILGLVFTLVILIVRLAHSHLQWPQHVAKFARLRMRILLAFAGTLPFAVYAYEAYDAIDSRSGEPVMLSFNAGIGGEAGQSNRGGDSVKLDKQEAEAAAAYRPGKLATPRNVILIVGDALRGEHMSVLQYSRPTTPYLDSLRQAERFALIQRIHSTCAESFCGLMSIARSKFVHEFSRKSLTIQQVLARHGYRIELILGGDHTNFYGLSEALGPTDLYWDGSMATDYVNNDVAVVDQVTRLANWDGKPTFLQLHLMSTHGLGSRQKEFTEQYVPAANYYRRWTGKSDEERSLKAVNYYDNGVMQFDAMVKEVLTTLQHKGFLEDAIVIITGDHGEMLGEHGLFSHASSVYQPVLDIPLLVLRYGYEGSAIEPNAFASQVDIAPTLLRELNLPVPESWSGTSLQDPVPREFVHFQQGMNVGLFDLRMPESTWKFWIDMRSEEMFAFNATLDIDESVNRIDEVPSRLRSEWMMQLVPAGASIRDSLSDGLFIKASQAILINASAKPVKQTGESEGP